MMVEIGHYALVLAFGLALVQGTLPLWGAARGDAGLIALARSTALGQFVFVSVAFGALIHAFATSDFSVVNVAVQLALDQAADLQDRRRVGQSRGLARALGVDPRAVRLRRRAVRAQPAARVPGPGAGGAGADRGRLSRLHAVHLEPVPASRSAAARWPGLQSDPPGSGARGASADAVRGLRRPLDRVRVRHRRADRGPGRCHLGALGAAVDARSPGAA